MDGMYILRSIKSFKMLTRYKEHLAIKITALPNPPQPLLYISFYL